MSLVKIAAAAAVVCAGSAAALTQTANAQSPGTPSAAEESQLEQIVVTARRREESLQDVPISVSALSGADLIESGVTDVLSLQNRTPALNVTTGGTSRNELRFALRGQRTGDTQLLTDSPVGTYFGEVLQARPHGFGLSFYDIQSVQVLKGVQGTLFGRNMTGGAVLVEPNQPGSAFDAEVATQFGNYAMRDIYGMVNVPITDRVALRLAGKTRSREGFTKDVSTGRDYDDQNFDSARASLLVKPTETIESLTIVDWIESDAHGSALYPTAIDPAAPGIGAFAFLRSLGVPVSDPVAEFARQQTFGDYRFDQGFGSGGNLDAYNVPPREKFTNFGVTNRTTFDIGGLTLKNIFGYRSLEFSHLQDLDGVPTFLINSHKFNDIEQFSEELQLQGSTFADRMTYVVGAFYFVEDGSDGSTSQQFPELAIVSQGLPLNTPALLFRNSLLGEGKAESYALYAAGTYNLSNSWKLSTGVRYTEDERRVAVTQSLPNSGVCLFRNSSGTPQPFSDCRQKNNASWDAVTWDLTLQYQPDDSLSTYLSTRRGFRAGGFSLRSVSTAELEPFDPEKVQEYEIGLKNQFHLGTDSSLSTTLALFYQDYTDVQKQFSGIDSQGNVTTIITNTAAQENYGGEFEASLRSGPVTFSAFYNYVDVKIQKGRDVGEFELVGAPHHQLGASLAYTTPLAGMGDLALNTNAVRRSSQYFDKNDLQGREPGYTLVNIRASLDSIGGTGFGAALFMNNVTDEKFRVGVIGIYKEAGYISSTYGEPRTYGAELNYRF